MDIRKIAIGPDYKGGAMHYLVGQNVLNNQYIIHLIRYDNTDGSIKIWIERDDELVLWKSLTHTMPIYIEYNINF